jgi:peptide/nickel transport system substrate-binding protein
MRRILLAAALLGLAAIAAPAAAQTLRIGLPASDVGTLDPHRATATQDKGVVVWVFSGLVRFPPGNADPAALEPDLAESWQVSPDGLSYTFRLRAGARFQHGFGEVTADDVVYSLRRAADREKSSFATDYAAVASIEAVDPRTVRVTLKEPVPLALGLFANYHGGNVVSRRAAEELGDGFRLRPVGSGPFAIDRVEAGQAVQLVAHEGYFRGKPKLAGITARYILSDSTRELAFTSGELELISGRREQRWVERMRGQRGTVVEVIGPGEFRTLLINTRRAPLDDLRVRQALAHAIDVGAIIRFVGPDVATRGVSPVPVGYLGMISDLPTFAPDVARARALLAEAGHPNGITVKSVVSNISAQLPIMEQVQAQLRRAGITLEMDIVDHATYHTRIRQDLSALTFYGAARYPVADSYLTQFYHSASAPGKPTMSLNFAHCAVADDLIDAARREPDAAKQMAMWAEAQRKIAAAICSIPLYDLRQVWVRTEKLDLGYTLTGAIHLAPAVTEATSIR